MSSNLIDRMPHRREQRQTSAAINPPFLCGHRTRLRHLPLRTVAVIGATEKPASVGRTILRNLMEQPSGATIYPINPHRPNVLGIRCYPNIALLGSRLIWQLWLRRWQLSRSIAGVRGRGRAQRHRDLSGFAELGANGRALEDKIRQVLASGHLRLIGPNCVG